VSANRFFNGVGKGSKYWGVFSGALGIKFFEEILAITGKKCTMRE